MTASVASEHACYHGGISEPGAAQTAPARGPAYKGGEVMGESSPDRHDVALWLIAAGRLIEAKPAEHRLGFARGDLDQSATGLIRKALAWLQDDPE